MFVCKRMGGVAAVAGMLAVGLLLCSGCGGPTYEGPERAAVSGTVTLDGNPIPYGNINFVPTGEGRPASGLIQKGNYAIPEEQGPNLGKYKVQISGYAEAPPESASTGKGDEEGDEEEAEDEEDVGPNIVPPQFNLNTTLEVEITSGENTHNFPLKSR